MLISIDFSHLQQHLDLLDQEMAVAKNMEQGLKDLRLDPQYELAELYNQQLQFLQDEIRNISRRKKLLEQTLDVFRASNKTIKDKIAETKHALNTAIC